MGDCLKILRRLEAYCDDELSRSERLEIEEHLGICPGCLDRKEFRVAFQAVLRRACREADPPADVISRIRAALKPGSSS